MSVTQHLACTTCKKYLWIGQGGIIYSTPEYLKALADFLYHEHNSSSYSGETHHLICCDEHELGEGLLAGFEEVRVE